MQEFGGGKAVNVAGLTLAKSETRSIRSASPNAQNTMSVKVGATTADNPKIKAKNQFRSKYYRPMNEIIDHTSESWVTVHFELASVCLCVRVCVVLGLFACLFACLLVGFRCIE